METQAETQPLAKGQDVSQKIAAAFGTGCGDMGDEVTTRVAQTRKATVQFFALSNPPVQAAPSATISVRSPRTVAPDGGGVAESRHAHSTQTIKALPMIGICESP
jgi:hypothetical protein